MTACHLKRCHSTPLQNYSVAGVMGQALFLFPFFLTLSSGSVLSIYSRYRFQSLLLFLALKLGGRFAYFLSSREERGERKGWIARRGYLLVRGTRPCDKTQEAKEYGMKGVDFDSYSMWRHHQTRGTLSKGRGSGPYGKRNGGIDLILLFVFFSYGN